MSLELYNKVRTVPDTALKPIQAGRLKGKSDINPMWRIKILTEQFGVCGVGWKYNITKQWLEHGGNGEISAFVNIELFIKNEGVWSDAIPGTGGSSFVANEKNGLYVSDECYKMALTDALSVACKALGVGADVYWQQDNTKYREPNKPQSQQLQQQSQPQQPQQQNNFKLTDSQIKRLYAIALSKGYDGNAVKDIAKKKYNQEHLHDLTKKQYDELCDGFDKLENKK